MTSGFGLWGPPRPHLLPSATDSAHIIVSPASTPAASQSGMCPWPNLWLLWAPCPVQECGWQGQVFPGSLPSAGLTWRLGPALPLLSAPAGLEPAGLDWGSRSPPAAPPHVVPTLDLGELGKSLLSPCSLGCFSRCVLDSNKIKEIASTLKKKKKELALCHIHSLLW